MTKGSISETFAKKWLQQKRWKIEAHRIEIAHVEVDFLARDPGGLLHIVEVKSGGSGFRKYISRKQMRRLERVALSLSVKEPVGLLLLVVSGAEIIAIRP